PAGTGRREPGPRQPAPPELRDLRDYRQDRRRRGDRHQSLALTPNPGRGGRPEGGRLPVPAPTHKSPVITWPSFRAANRLSVVRSVEFFIARTLPSHITNWHTPGCRLPNDRLLAVCSFQRGAGSYSCSQ